MAGLWIDGPDKALCEARANGAARDVWELLRAGRGIGDGWCRCEG